MNPRIVELDPKLLVGMNLNMSLANNKTQELFSIFMPIRNTIQHATSTDVFEVMIYDQMHFQGFDPSKT
ncbi:MAG: GyrI-like domain-containing protein, partial [Flavobacteriaceae bacterium]